MIPLDMLGHLQAARGGRGRKGRSNVTAMAPDLHNFETTAIIIYNDVLQG